MVASSPLKRADLVFSAFCAASGSMAAFSFFGVGSVAGTLPIGLYPLYTLAAASGWILGNVYVGRARSSGAPRHWLLIAIYLVGPAGPLSLLRAMGDPGSLVRAPAVPLFSFGVYAIFFLVPLSLRATAPSRRSVRLAGESRASTEKSPQEEKDV